MRDYAELVKGLRCCSKIDARNNGCDSCPYEYCGEDCQNLCGYAADAIEGLLALACPHHHRNVHDRGDDSYCDALNREVPKEVE